MDNGFADRKKQGERGDFDGDGLSNREEYLLATNPANADTDGDGISDYDEMHLYKTSPTDSNSIAVTEVNSLDISGYNVSGSTGSWQVADGGLLGSTFRGKVEWTFEVPSAGIWMLEMGGRLRGTLRSFEELHLGVFVDGKVMDTHRMEFVHGQPSSLKVVTPYLTAGQHTFRIDIRNEVGRRKLQILSLKVLGTGGFDGDSNARPDWLDSLLFASNTLAPIPAESFISPLFVEGSTRYLGGTSLNSSSLPVPVQRGLGDLHWYANVPLQAVGETSALVVFEDRTVVNATEWVRWNSLGGSPLAIRLGDSVKIAAWVNSPVETASVTITVDGQTRNLLASESFIKQFNQPGAYPITVSHDGNILSASSINVVTADFGNPHVSYSDAPKWTEFPSVPNSLVITAEPSVRIHSTGAFGTGSKARFSALRYGEHRLAARLPNGGAIVAFGSIRSLSVSDALKNDAATYIGSTSDGYRVLRSPIWVGGLPEGGKVVITIFRSGVTFLDGTSVKELYAADFEEGIAYLEFRYPDAMGGGYCHYIDVYDAGGRHLGRR